MLSHLCFHCTCIAAESIARESTATTVYACDLSHVRLACRGGVGRAGMIAACLLLYTQDVDTAKVSSWPRTFAYEILM